MIMNIRDLQYLVMVADLGHFGKAAAQCHVSQPTLSMQIKKMEDQLGTALIERTNKSVMITPAGEQVVAHARRVLAEVEAIKQLTRAAADPLAGDFRLGIFPTLAPYLLPRLVPQIRQHFPNINLLLVEEKTERLITLLDNGGIDAAILAMPVDHDHFDHVGLFSEPFTLAVSREHPLAKRKTVALDDLHALNILLLDEGHCLRDQALQVCQSIGVGEAKNFRATSLETLRHMVAGSDAVTLMPELATRPEDAHVRYIPFAKLGPSRNIGLFWRKTSARAALCQAIKARIYALKAQRNPPQ